MTLTLSTMDHPAKPQKTVLIFGTSESAMEHIEKHVLVDPECRAWPMIEPESAFILGLDTGRERARLLQKFKKALQIRQDIYDLYAKVIRLESKEASELHWIYHDAQETICLGTSGMLVVIENCVVTAFFAGQDTTLIEQGADAPDKLLPQNRSMRSGRDKQSQRELAAHRSNRLSQDEQSPAERVYYYLFRKAVQFVRSFHPSPFSNCSGHYWKLQDNLPRMRNLKLECWQQLRQQFDRSPR